MAREGQLVVHLNGVFTRHCRWLRTVCRSNREKRLYHQHEQNDLLPFQVSKLTMSQLQLTVDHHLVGRLLRADGVGQLTRVLSVVLLLQWLDHHGTHVFCKHQAAPGRQRLAVFQPGRGRHIARRSFAADVSCAVAGEEDVSWAAEFDTGDAICQHGWRESAVFQGKLLKRELSQTFHSEAP